MQVTPVYDFFGYNTINAESVKDIMDNYADNYHYAKRAGDLLSNPILADKEKENEVSADFGVLVTGENIEPHLARILGDGEEWVKTHPNELDSVESLQIKFV